MKQKTINQIKKYRAGAAWEIDHPDVYQCVKWTDTVENTEWCDECMDNLSLKQLTLALRALKNYYGD